MKTLNPSHLKTEQGVSSPIKLGQDHMRVLQSIHKALNGNIATGSGRMQNPVAGINQGVYTQFETENSNGVHVRIAANGVSGTGAAYNWAGLGVGVPINHGLQRQPIGFYVVDADKDVRVYRTTAPNSTQITLASSDNTASVTLYIY